MREEDEAHTTFLKERRGDGRRPSPTTLTPELRVTKDTDLGDNETIKAPQPMPITPFPNRGKRRRNRSE